jgi:hypothetical protein
MRIVAGAGVDLSDFSSQIDAEKYRRLKKTHIRLLSQQVPESFLDKFEDEETALSELLDAIYGTMDQEEESYD